MTVADLSTKCDENGGVLAVTLGELRDAVNADRLGKLVMQRISGELAAHGLGYFPADLIDGNDTPRQYQQVRLYRRGNTTTARAIEAVLSPSGLGDAFLGGLSSNGAQATLDRVREIVCIAG